MPAIYHAGVVQIVPQYDIGRPTRAANVLHWQTSAVGLVTSQLTAVQSAFDTAWAALWRPTGSGSSFYVGSIVTDMASNTGAQVTNTGHTPQAGTGSGGPLIENSALLLSLHTPTRYRGGHGRIYLPGIAMNASASDGEGVFAGTITALNTAWTNLLNAMSALTGAAGGPYQPIVWHKTMASNPNSVELVRSHEITTNEAQILTL